MCHFCKCSSFHSVLQVDKFTSELTAAMDVDEEVEEEEEDDEEEEEEVVDNGGINIYAEPLPLPRDPKDLVEAPDKGTEWDPLEVRHLTSYVDWLTRASKGRVPLKNTIQNFTAYCLGHNEGTFVTNENVEPNFTKSFDIAF